jgi:uridine kinase
MNFISCKNINSAITKDPESFVVRCEKIYNNKITTAAEQIRLFADERPLVLIAGPSGSGKTTTAAKIGDALRKREMGVINISMDNYFLPCDCDDDIPLDEHGNVDYETPLRVDIPLFSSHLEKMFRCEKITLPEFDFKTQMRRSGETIKRKSSDIIIIEGIHALNPLVLGDSEDFTFGVYMSVQTEMISTDGTTLKSGMIRLMRRLCRDRIHRGRSVNEIWDMYKTVAAGEEKYIKPFRSRAEIDIDTFLPYEASVYKGLLMNDLSKAAGFHAGNKDFTALVTILNEIHTLPQKYVPEFALIHEFADLKG